MRSISSVRLTTLILVAIAVTFVARFAHAQSTREEGVISAYTEPSKRVKHAFNALGVIDKVEVKEGDPVKSGQVLMLQDAEVEALELERLKAEADSQARVEYAAADLDVKKKIYERKSKAGEGVFPVAEVEEAELAVTAGDKQLEIAKLDSSQNKIKARQQQAKVDRMGLKSKIDGVVEKIDIWEGEMADPSKPAIIVVRNDPAYVMIKDLKSSQVARLNVAEEIEVRYPDQTNWMKAKIIFISPVADASSDVQLVKLELPNPENRATGVPIQVKLPAKLLSAQGEKTAENR